MKILIKILIKSFPMEVVDSENLETQLQLVTLGTRRIRSLAMIEDLCTIQDQE